MEKTTTLLKSKGCKERNKRKAWKLTMKAGDHRPIHGLHRQHYDSVRKSQHIPVSRHALWRLHTKWCKSQYKNSCLAVPKRNWIPTQQGHSPLQVPSDPPTLPILQAQWVSNQSRHGLEQASRDDRAAGKVTIHRGSKGKYQYALLLSHRVDSS